MKSLPALLTACLLGSTVIVSTSAGADSPASPVAAPAVADKDAAYAKVLEKRSADILAALDLGDSTKAARVQARIIAQYRALNAWQEANEARLKELQKTKDSDPAKSEIAAIHASRRTLRDDFIDDLAKDLTPAQIDTVKDKLTYNKLQVTYNGYIQMLPTLTEEQKKKIHDYLVEAREEAFVGISSHEKDDIFGRYKGRINNYLSKQGYDLNQAGKDWKTRRDAEAREKK